MFHSRLDNRSQAINVAARPRGQHHPGTVNSAGMAANRTQLAAAAGQNDDQGASPQQPASNGRSAAANQGSSSGVKQKGTAGPNSRIQQARQFKAANSGGVSQAASNAAVKLPRTGIEQVFCTERPKFIEAHREFERVATVNVSFHCFFHTQGAEFSRKLLDYLRWGSRKVTFLRASIIFGLLASYGRPFSYIFQISCFFCCYNDILCSFFQPLLAEEYEQHEMEYGSGANAKIVFDCMEEHSPFYDKSKGEIYLDES